MKKRIVWLDYVRTFAIVLVVLTHAIEGVYDLSVQGVLSASFISKLFLFNAFNLTRHGVPLFLMISGYLLLSRVYTLGESKDPKQKSCYYFWKNNLLKLLITIEIWIVIYHFFSVFVYGKEFSLISLFRKILLIDGVGFTHEWYMYMILAMYILLPFISYIVNHMELKAMVFPMFVTIVLCFLLPTISKIRGFYGDLSVDSKLNSYYAIGYYEVYLLFGFLIRKQVLKQIKTRYLLFTSVVFFSLGTYFQWKAYLLGTPYMIWYNFFTLLPTSVCIFEIFSRISFKENGISKIVNNCSKSAFGIYLLHNLILNLFYRYTPLYFKPPINVCIYCVSAFCISWFIVFVISKIPKVGKYIVYV